MRMREPRVAAVSISEWAHVVAVADVGERDLLQSPKLFLQSEVVGQRLAGMLQVAERVDHRDARVLRHPFDRLVGEGAQHDGVHPALDVVRHVAQEFRARRGAPASDP